MNRSVALCIIIVLFGTLISITFCAPSVLNDSNLFLKEFVGSQLLGFLGVVVTITLASATNIHFELNKLAEKAKRDFFLGSRKAISDSVNWLIGLLLFAIFLVVAKSQFIDDHRGIAFINGIAVIIVIFNILVLIDLTQMAFKIKPEE